jgi:tRNA-splicing ligase RtcB
MVKYKIWGQEHIEAGAIAQMEAAANLPVSIAGALMPDAHQGYGLPIGGVLATDNVVIPYAVGVDIACRMMLTVYPINPQVLNNPIEAARLKDVLLKNTQFGAGGEGVHSGNIAHPVLDNAAWRSTPLLRSLHQTAIQQIGTSGTGNHFVEWGELTISNPTNTLRLPAGQYLALLSHSGSRGVGYKIADYYTKIAMNDLRDLDSTVKHLAWLSLDKDAGQEYWEAMHLAGEFASANHHIIHQRVAKGMGLTAVATVENHHNFAWKEKILINGREREVIVHRKGATPADKGALGIIPGTMADLGYLVAGKGNVESLNSAAHGGGRAMSRTSAKKHINRHDQDEYLRKRNVTLIGGGQDEAPQAYKPIEKIIDAQKDLVDILGTFQPRIVRMASDRPGRWKPMPKGVHDGVVD